MMKSNLALAVTVATAMYTLPVSALETVKSEEIKTVAWYVANIKEARAKNKECYGDADAKELQLTPNCVNSLQALKMSFALAD